MRSVFSVVVAALLVLGAFVAPARAEEPVPTFDELVSHPVALRPELTGVHPRVFATGQELEALRKRARTTHRDEWTRVLQNLPALTSAPPPPPGPQARRSQNNAAYAIVGAALAWQIERRPEYLEAARRWTLAAIDYEPWGYTYNKPNVDLAAGHLLYAIGWAYDLLYNDLSSQERVRIRASLERHAQQVYNHFAPGKDKKFAFTQNHDFIPTAGLGVAALALMGESADAPRWAALARAHHHRAAQMLSPDGYYYEGVEYWIFSMPWLVHFLDAWEHSTGESLWNRDVFRNWKLFMAHVILPDGQNAFDIGDAWEGAHTRAKSGNDYVRVYPGGTLQSNYNVLYRVASRFQDAEAQAVAERLASFGHSNLEEYWTLLWRDAELEAASMDRIPLAHHFKDSGVFFQRTSWNKDALAFAFKAGPPQGHRVAELLARMPEARLDSGHAHPDAGSFIIWAHGRYLTGDTGYAGIPNAANHNTLTFGEFGQGKPVAHDVWRELPYQRLTDIRIRDVKSEGGRVRIVADVAAAYPDEARLKRFTRTFSFDGRDTFTVEDQVELGEARVVNWHLQSDAPFEQRGGRYFNGGVAGAGVELSMTQPARVSFAAGEASVKSPGPPGKIETGSLEQRGYMLTASTPAPVTRATFSATLKVRPPVTIPQAGATTMLRLREGKLGAALSPDPRFQAVEFPVTFQRGRAP
ncbi:MAG: heparinase II/III family protein [Myxococcota bacterium]